MPMAISLGRKQQGYPTCYKVDCGNRRLRIAIEADGLSHNYRRELDAKKDAKLASLGWTVLRFSNQQIVDWMQTGMPMDHVISTILRSLGIHPSRSEAC